MNFSDVLNAPRDAIYNLGRGAYRGLSGEGSIDDFVGAIPGALGILGAGMAAPFTGGLSLPFGAALAGASQLGGKLTGQDRFDAAAPSELLKALGYDNPDDFSTFATGMATDPMTWLMGAGSIKGGSKIASMFGRAAPEAEAVASAAAQAGKTAVRRPAAIADLVGGPGEETAQLMQLGQRKAAMLASPERKALEALRPEGLPGNPYIEGMPYRPSPDQLARTRAFRQPSPSSIDIGYEPEFGSTARGSGETMGGTPVQSSPLLEALGGATGAPLGLPVRPSLGSPLLTSEALGAAEQTMPGGYVMAMQKKPIQTFEGAPQAMFRRGKEVVDPTLLKKLEMMRAGFNPPDYPIFPGGIGR